MKMFLHHDLHRQIWREIEALSAKLRDGGMCEEQAARRATRVGCHASRRLPKRSNGVSESRKDWPLATAEKIEEPAWETI